MISLTVQLGESFVMGSRGISSLDEWGKKAFDRLSITDTTDCQGVLYLVSPSSRIYHPVVSEIRNLNPPSLFDILYNYCSKLPMQY